MLPRKVIFNSVGISHLQTSYWLQVSTCTGLTTLLNTSALYTLTVLLDEEEFDLDFRYYGRIILSFLNSVSIKREEDSNKPVIAIPDVSKAYRHQIKAIEAEHGVRIEIDADLLNEVSVEYPTAFMGSFDAKYLWSSRRSFGNLDERTPTLASVVRDQDGKLPTKLHFSS